MFDYLWKVGSELVSQEKHKQHWLHNNTQTETHPYKKNVDRMF